MPAFWKWESAPCRLRLGEGLTELILRPNLASRRWEVRTLSEAHATPRHLLIVTRSEPRVYEYVKRTFAGEHTVEVILDRRLGERRRASASPAAERRRADRRSSPSIRDRLRSPGWAVVHVNDSARRSS